MNAVANPSSAQASAAGYFVNTRPEVAALLPERCARVLEIGCGEGRFSGHVKQREAYWGVEPAAAAADKAAGVLDRVVTGTFDDAYDQLPDAYFDLVVCNDVIEHMPDHDAFLQRIQRKMTPGARIVGSVPNVRFLPHLMQLLLKKDWRYVDAGILDRTHQRFFTERSFLRTVAEHGFEVELFRGLNSITAGPTFLGRWRWRVYLGIFQLLTLSDQRDARFMQLGFRLRRPG